VLRRFARSDRPSGLDVTLLGLIAAIIGGYGRAISVPTDTSPHLIRFFSVSPDRTYSAVMPQDKALLLLSDPSLDRPRRTATDAALSLDGVWSLVFVAGLVLLVAGPTLAWMNRRED
jgi:hypothetical protein